MIIPLSQLPVETVSAIIEEFILREGTEYGAYDVSKADKIEQVWRQLKKGTALLVYSELHESVNILPADQFQQGQEEQDYS